MIFFSGNRTDLKTQEFKDLADEWVDIYGKSAADVVAMTTLYEGHANIPMEAHACQKPIVSNAVDGVRLSVTDGVDGFLVIAGDVQGFAEKLILLCRSEELRNRLGEAGLKNLQQFAIEKVMAKYSTVIKALIEN